MKSENTRTCIYAKYTNGYMYLLCLSIEFVPHILYTVFGNVKYSKYVPHLLILDFMLKL